MTSGVDVARAAKAAGFPDGELVTAVAVAFAESTFNAGAINRSNRNGSTDYGLWQINSVHGFPELSNGQWRQPAVNASMALRVWQKQGWKAWSVHSPTDALGYARYVAAIPAATAFVATGVGVGPAAAGTVGLPQDVASSAGDVAGEALDVAGEIAREPLAVLRWASRPETWIRGIKLLIGGAVFVVGAYVFFTSTLAKPVVDTAKQVVGGTGKVAGKAAQKATTATKGTA